MYHETTYKQLRERRVQGIRLAVLSAILVALLWWAFNLSQDIAREQGAAALRESVLRAATQCCAVEGSYPSSLQHLREHYGLVYNSKDYQVAYEWLGDNVMPSVVVRPL